jgi:hypothetical protein
MRPTNKHHISIYYNGDKDKFDFWAKVPTYIWEVEADKLEPVTFKEVYADGCNASDRVAGDWLLANFAAICPTSIDSDVLVDKNDCGEGEKWERLNFEPEKAKGSVCPVDASPVLAVLGEFDYDYYEPGDHCGHKWPCVEIDGLALTDPAVERIHDLLLCYDWELNEVIDADAAPPVWDMRPVGYTEPEFDDSDDSDDSDDGWQGILLTHVFLVDDGARDAKVLCGAGFRVLKHEATDTVIAQVTYCGMSNEVNRARAGFLLAVDRGWPILTSQGWRRPV